MSRSLSFFVQVGLVSLSSSSCTFSQWDNLNALSYQADFLCGDFPWLACMDPNFWVNFTHADRPDQPNLYFWVKISRWANLANFHPIWFKFCTEVISKPLNRFRMFEVAATIFRPTSPTNQNRPIALRTITLFRFLQFLRPFSATEATHEYSWKQMRQMENEMELPSIVVRLRKFLAIGSRLF